MNKIECRKDGVVKCVYYGEETLPNAEVLKALKASGYKLYKDGKIYKPAEK